MFRENGPSVCDIALRVNDAEKNCAASETAWNI